MSAAAGRALVLALLASAALRAQGGDEPPVPAPQPAVAQNPFKPFDRAAYVAHLRSLGATDAQVQAFERAVAEVGEPRAADDLVRAMNPAIDVAVDLSEKGDPKAAIELAKVLAATADPVVSGHIRYHLARVFLDGDDPEAAVDILNEYLTANINRTPLDGEVAFFYATALADVPRPELALPRLRAFLAWFPNASERFRATAQQRIGELEKQQESKLHTLADRMKRVERDLYKRKTDDPVQGEELSIVEELKTLIEEQEEREKQAGGAPSGNQQPSGPATQSALPEGEGRIGNLEKRVSLADRWGPTRDKERKEIESMIQNGLPPQYRKLLEEYYKKLGTSGAGGR